MAGTMPAPDGGANPFAWNQIIAQMGSRSAEGLRRDTQSMRDKMADVTVARQNNIMGLGLASQNRQNTFNENEWEGQTPSRLGMLRGTGGGSSAISVDKAPEQYREWIKQAAAKEGVDPDLLASLLNQESGFKAGVTGKMTKYGVARGMGQFLDATARSVGITNPYDPQQAIFGSAKYLGDNLKKFGGDTRAALAAYNWGPGNAAKWLANGADPNRLPAETRNYITSITGGRNSKAVTAMMNEDGTAPSNSEGYTDGRVAISKSSMSHIKDFDSKYDILPGQTDKRGIQYWLPKAADASGKPTRRKIAITEMQLGQMSEAEQARWRPVLGEFNNRGAGMYEERIKKPDGTYMTNEEEDQVNAAETNPVPSGTPAIPTATDTTPSPIASPAPAAVTPTAPPVVATPTATPSVIPAPVPTGNSQPISPAPSPAAAIDPMTATDSAQLAPSPKLTTGKKPRLRVDTTTKPGFTQFFDADTNQLVHEKPNG